MLKADGLEVGFGGVPARKRLALDLIKPPFVVEHRGLRVTAVRPMDGELTAIDPIDAVGDVDLDLAAGGQRLDRMVEDDAFLQVGAGEIGDHHLEDGVVLADRIDARRDRAAVGDLIGRGFDLRSGGKGDREGIVGIGVFLPALGGGGTAGDQRRQDKSD